VTPSAYVTMRSMATRTSKALPRDLRFEPTPKRVRAQAADETVADSRAALLVWEPNRAVPVYAFPAAGVRADLLADSANPVPDAHGGGATFYTLTAGDDPVENAAWRYADPDLAGHVALSWEAFDRWLEEDDEVFGHPRDPWHRVDGRRSSRHVRVEIDGAVVAESRRPTIVFETGLPTRYYLPHTDVRFARLVPSDTRTQCPYKGRTSGYWSVAGGPADVAWSYDFPAAAVLPIAGLVAFLDEAVDVVLDGVAQERPVTHFSR
jgi:uncharacterized protein (DUF427 family)